VAASVSGPAAQARPRCAFVRGKRTVEPTLSSERWFLSGCYPKANLVVASIVLWNTVHLERAVTALRERGQAVSDELLAHLSPLGWEHINLTGDYVWKPGGREVHRPLRQLRLPIGQDDEGP
jgi:hypothetical protein